jgi:hypothetical protein
LGNEKEEMEKVKDEEIERLKDEKTELSLKNQEYIGSNEKLKQMMVKVAKMARVGGYNEIIEIISPSGEEGKKLNVVVKHHQLISLFILL